MATGKDYEEIYKPAVRCDAGKWTGTRVFKVETSSPSVAILTIFEDASIPPGTSWDEGCDPDFAAATTTDIKMRSKTYDTQPLGSEHVVVTVAYEDSRYNVEYDETTLGFVRRYYKFGMSSDVVYQTIGDVLAYDSTRLSTGTAFFPTVTVGSTSVPDRRIGWDGETLAGANIETPTMIYGEVWRLNATGSGVYGSSTYAPGVYDEIDYAARLSNTEPYMLAKRTGFSWDFGDPLVMTMAMALFGYTGTVNSQIWREFPIRSLLMQPPHVQQVGGTAYILNFEWAYSPPYYYDLSSSMESPEIYIGESQLESLEKAGWDYLWYQYAAGTDKQQVEEIRVAQVKQALDFTALGLGA
jgi:hypothetical protein